MASTSESIFHSSLDSSKIHVLRMEGIERLSRCFEYTVELVRESHEGAVAVDDLLGKNVTVELKDQDGQSRMYNGWVIHFENTGAQGRFDTYRVELRPWFWYLTLGADCRIFQNKTVVQIIDEVCSGYSSKLITKRLNGSYRTRAFCVQYRESDFAFLSRLMEDEGIYFHFEHEKGKHEVILCDHADAHEPVSVQTLRWRKSSSGKYDNLNFITHWVRRRSVRSTKYVHTDYDPLSPATDLSTEKSRTPSHPKPKELEVFDYPGDYDDQAYEGNTGTAKKEGERLAGLRVETFTAHFDVFEADTLCRGVTAGYSFDFEDHADAGKYLITENRFKFGFRSYEADHTEGEWGFEAQLTGIPKSVRYHAPPITRRPIIPGPQTAVVVGPEGDEIHTDEYGRVKVQFRWDRVGEHNQTSSCWIRVSHPWAGKKFGMIALPRIGDEVVVEFLEGNPDRPLVTGRVYNAERMPPYELPAQQTVTGIRSHSTKQGGEDNFNELRFDDLKGSEYVWFQAEKDYHQLVKNDAKITVKNDRWDKVEKNVAQQIGENLTLDIGKKATLSIKEDVHAKLGADFNLKIEGALNTGITDAVAVKGDQAIQITSGQGMDINVGQALNATATSSVHIKGMGVVIDGSTTLCIKAGGSFILVGPDGVTIQGAMVKINSGGSAGNANDAAQASPADPTDPTLPDPDQDPLQSSG